MHQMRRIELGEKKRGNNEWDLFEGKNKKEAVIPSAPPKYHVLS